MAFVTDPDDLDRYQILVDPEAETINIRGLGAHEDLTNGGTVYEKTDGQIISGATDNFQSSTSDFQNGPVSVGDILVVSNPTTSGCINFWEITTINSATSLDVEDAIDGSAPNMTVPSCTFKVFDPTAVAGGQGGNVGDGVTLQALYSFLKEEWRTLSNSNMVDLIQFTFPLESITREQFEIGGPTHSNWDWANDTTRYLVRTGGWAALNQYNVVQSHWPGVITLGTLDSDTQVYFLLENATSGTPEDFQLTGAVNQSIKTLEIKSGSTGVYGGDETLQFRAWPGEPAIGRTNNWVTAGFASGDVIQVVGAENSANNGYFTADGFANSGAGTNNLMWLSPTDTIVENSADTTARIEAMTDNRSFMEIFARKKARSYAKSDIAAIGVTELETIVNRFPLTHAADPAISLDDGQLAGDPSETDFATVTQVGGTSTNGSLYSTGSGTFVLTSAGATFITDDMHAGDTLELVEGDAYDGFYEIYSVDSETQMTCFEEPGETMGSLSNEDFKRYTRWRSQGSANGQIEDAPGTGSGTLTDAGAAFDTDGVDVGDMCVIQAGEADSNHLGIYKVLGVVSATEVVLDTSDEDTFPGSPDTGITYWILQPTMALQHKLREATSRGPLTTSGFKFNPNGDLGYRIRREESPYDWDDDGYIAGGSVTFANATSGNFDGTYLITAVSGDANTDDTIFVVDTDGSFPTWYGDDVYDDKTATCTGEYGFIRTLNGVDYSFRWRMFGNGGDLNECFQFVQRQLRRGRANENTAETDLTPCQEMYRGDITDLLMSYATPTGRTINMYIDDLDSTELNNITLEDLLGEDRNFAYIAGVQITLNANILNASTNKIVVFFTDPDINGAAAEGNEFGTAGAIIVQDKDGVDMEATNQTTSPLNFEFDYDNNSQGGRLTSEGSTGVTIVAICTDTGQYVQTTGSITRTSSNVFSLVAGLERNYSNP